MLYNLLSTALLASLTLASPTLLSARQNAVTCGNNYYSYDQVNNALNQGYNYYENDEQVGNDDYPHQYNNYEDCSFQVSGPYQEFPIEESGVYSGGSPGADRIIFNTNGEYAGSITHTGSSRHNGFVGCSDTQCSS